MKRMTTEWTLALAAMLLAGTAGATPYAWITNANGYWTNSANWNPNSAFPDAAGDGAILDAPTAGLTATRTVTLSGTRTVGTLLLDSEFPANANTFNVSGGKLVMDSGGSQPAVIMFGTNSHAANTVSTPIEMASDLHLAMQSQYGNGYMTLSGGIASPDGQARTLSYRQWREGGQNGGYINISGPITGGSTAYPLRLVSDGNPVYTGLNSSDRPLYLNGANTFTGSLEVVRGGISVASSFGAAGNSVVFSNGTWLWAGNFTAPSNTAFTLASNAMFSVGSGTFDIPGPLTVPVGGTLTKAGNGTFRVSGDNAATFATNAAITYSGILDIGHSNALGTARAFTLSNYALLSQTAAADPKYTYNVQAYGGIGGNSTFFDSLTFGISGGGNMDIASNAIVFGNSLDAMNAKLKAAGRGREFYQLAGTVHTVRVDRVWKGVANLNYGAYTGSGEYVLSIDTDCDFVLRSRGLSGVQSFAMNQLAINANGNPVVITLDGHCQLNNSPAAGYTNVTFRILNNVVHAWEGNAFGQNNKHAHVVVENSGSLRCGTHGGATPVAIGATLKVRAGGQVTLDPERAAALRILSGATLSGAGAIGPKETQMESGSTLSPGEDGVGTLAFTTKLQMKAGSACTWELGATTNDVANVSVANVTFDGAWTLRIRDAGGKPKPAQPYVLLTYNTLTGFNPANVAIDYGTTKWLNASISDDSVNKRLVLTGLSAPTQGTVIMVR